MTPKEYLSQINRLDIMIGQRIEQKEELEQLGGIKGQGLGEKVQSSPKGEASFVRTFEQIEAINEEVNILIDRYADLKNRIIGQIQAMRDSRYAEILFKRYVEIKLFSIIATEMKCSYRQIKRLHNYALSAFGEQFSDSLKNCPLISPVQRAKV